MLVAAMNPCPCGYYNHPEKVCSCGEGLVHRYLNRISGPLLDRIDLHVEVTPVNYDDLANDVPKEGSLEIRERVIKARLLQQKRFELTSTSCNANMSSREIKEFCQLDSNGVAILRTAMERMGLSARAYDRILKVARTIADLNNSLSIEVDHLAEAIQYRNLDKGLSA